MTYEIEKTSADFRFKGWPDPDLPRHLDGETVKRARPQNVRIDLERHKDYCVVGGGGEASSYIAKQELDRSLRHPVGKAGFIQDSVTMHKSEMIEIVKKKIN